MAIRCSSNWIVVLAVSVFALPGHGQTTSSGVKGVTGKGANAKSATASVTHPPASAAPLDLEFHLWAIRTAGSRDELGFHAFGPDTQPAKIYLSRKSIVHYTYVVPAFSVHTDREDATVYDPGKRSQIDSQSVIVNASGDEDYYSYKLGATIQTFYEWAWRPYSLTLKNESLNEYSVSWDNEWGDISYRNISENLFYTMRNQYVAYNGVPTWDGAGFPPNLGTHVLTEDGISKYKDHGWGVYYDGTSYNHLDTFVIDGENSGSGWSSTNTENDDGVITIVANDDHPTLLTNPHVGGDVHFQEQDMSIVSPDRKEISDSSGSRTILLETPYEFPQFLNDLRRKLPAYPEQYLPPAIFGDDHHAGGIVSQWEVDSYQLFSVLQRGRFEITANPSATATMFRYQEIFDPDGSGPEQILEDKIVQLGGGVSRIPGREIALDEMNLGSGDYYVMVEDLPVQVTKIWSDQFPSSDANQLPNEAAPSHVGSGSKKHDYILVGGRDPSQQVYIKAKVDCPDISEFKSKFKFALARMSGDVPFIKGPTTAIDENDELLLETSQIDTVSYSTDDPPQDYAIVGGYDSNGNGLENSEISYISEYRIRPVSFSAYDGNKAWLSAYVIGGWIVNRPFSAAFLEAFLTGNTISGVGGSVVSETMSIQDDDHPDHHAGIAFNSATSGPIRRYVWSQYSVLAYDIAASEAVTGLIRPRLASVAIKNEVQHYIWQPGESQKTFVWTLHPTQSDVLLSFPEVDLHTSFGSAWLRQARIAVTVDKNTLTATSVVIQGTLTDLYDWNYEEGYETDRRAATVQAGYPTLGVGGWIFRLQVDMDTATPLPSPSYNFN